MQRSCREDLTGKGGSGLEGLPGPAQASARNQNLSLLFTILCLSPTLNINRGAIPDHLSLKKINLEL